MAKRTPMMAAASAYAQAVAEQAKIQGQRVKAKDRYDSLVKEEASALRNVELARKAMEEAATGKPSVESED